MNLQNSTTRFSNTVENYLQYRPGYPQAFIDYMKEEMALHENAIIADIGSGTGKLTQLFLENGNTVFGIEPNYEMRQAAEKLLERFPNFNNCDGTAEITSIEDSSVDFLTAAQAFHWFDVAKTRKEFQRILKRDGKVLLIWNKRLDEKSDFMKAYNRFLESYSTDLQSINLRRVANEEGMTNFYGENNFSHTSFEHFQEFDCEGLIGRYLSCSYAYQKGHPKFKEAMDVLKVLFEEHQENGFLKMWYEMVVYWGNLK